MYSLRCCTDNFQCFQFCNLLITIAKNRTENKVIVLPHDRGWRVEPVPCVFGYKGCCNMVVPTHDRVLDVFIKFPGDQLWMLIGLYAEPDVPGGDFVLHQTIQYCCQAVAAEQPDQNGIDFIMMVQAPAV